MKSRYTLFKPSSKIQLQQVALLRVVVCRSRSGYGNELAGVAKKFNLNFLTMDMNTEW